jgi:hypothetical protein
MVPKQLLPALLFDTMLFWRMTEPPLEIFPPFPEVAPFPLTVELFIRTVPELL